ncbi:MAG: dihydrolipoamide acetyltransferase family protein [Bacteroidales bacterium]
MQTIEIRIPAMGEGITEATISRYLKKEGEVVSEDESIAEISTDKVDSEIASPCDGTIDTIVVKEGDSAKVGEVILTILTKQDSGIKAITEEGKTFQPQEIKGPPPTFFNPVLLNSSDNDILFLSRTPSDRFLSPLVRNIAKTEGISVEEIDKIIGTGLGNRITKEDILAYSEKKKNGIEGKQTENKKFNDNLIEIIEMDRMRKLIAAHMVESKKISPHVTSFMEVDMTNIVNWRNSVKDGFYSKFQTKLTFMPLFIDAVAKSILEFPHINVSVEDTKIIVKKRINIGIATALPNGNLIVPVIKDVASLELHEISKTANDLAERARSGKLKPDEITGGTFTITNVGTFGNLTGTPIINQPEVAIIAVGEIKKKPAVIETPMGDTIGIRHIMIMSMSYDHRVVDGALGGMFLKKVAEKLENFDPKKQI